MDECTLLLEKIRVLARVSLPREDCERIIEIRGFLKEISRAKEHVRSVSPLYHVWEAETRMREGEKGYGKVRVEDLGVETREGYVRLPWRGSM